MSNESDRTHDVLIVGSGAAGGAAAVHLALAGHDVLTLERDAEPRIKPCGGGMAASVQQWFPFSLEPAVEQVKRWISYFQTRPFRRELNALRALKSMTSGAMETSGTSRQPTDAIGRGEPW